MLSFAVASHPNEEVSTRLEQSCQDLGADFFDQFLTFDPIDSEGSDCLALPDSTLLAKPSRGRSFEGTSTSLSDDEPALSNYTPALGSHFNTELSGRDAISDSELLSLENTSLGSPISPLSPINRANSLPSRTTTQTPTLAGTIIARRSAQNSGPIPKVFKKAHRFEKSLKSAIQKSGMSPKMMRDSVSFRKSFHVLASKLQSSFDHSVTPSTPTPTARPSDASNASELMDGTAGDVFGFSEGLPQKLNGRPTEYDTPLATPVLDSRHSRKACDQQPFLDGMGFPPTPQFNQPFKTWSQMPESPELNGFRTPAAQTPGAEPPLWWNHAATAAMAQPSPRALHINPRRATKSHAYQLQNDLSYEANVSAKGPSGLKIQMPGIPVQDSFVVPSPHMIAPYLSQQVYYGPQIQPPGHQYPLPPRPYMPEAAAHFRHSSTMRKIRSSMRKQCEPPSPKTNASSFHLRKRRTKASKEKQKPPIAKMDFVNFTPSDSRKILTGVAPSGSSKTRARREKEAMEKRRKLSMAALRAVRAAGGDVESLVEQGLFA